MVLFYGSSMFLYTYPTIYGIIYQNKTYKDKSMSVRILSFGKNLKHLNICIEEKIIGFKHMFSQNIENDLLYIVVGKSFCCARATISYAVDYNPWDNPELYVLCHRIKNIEYCTPFSLKFLENTSAGKAWALAFVQSSKIIKDEDALKMLHENFQNNISNKFYQFAEDEINPPKKKRGRKPSNVIENTDSCDKEMVLDNNIDDDDNDVDPIDIMSTFKTIKFVNESDKLNGLEALVNKNFYKLFTSFQEQNSIFISDNSYFPTIGRDDTNGIGGKPDALLISFDNDDKKSKIKINIIEYECYGKTKTKSTQKFNHLNSHIIPQLIRFASTFGVVTDSKIREKTIKSWVNKIIDYVKNDITTLEPKIYNWLKKFDPQIRQSYIMDNFRNELFTAFNNNIRIMLIIDELTSEQNETIKNVIRSFKLFGNGKDDSKYIDFSGHVVRLEHMLNYDDKSTSKYALSIQDN